MNYLAVSASVVSAEVSVCCPNPNMQYCVSYLRERKRRNDLKIDFKTNRRGSTSNLGATNNGWSWKCLTGTEWIIRKNKSTVFSQTAHLFGCVCCVCMCSAELVENIMISHQCLQLLLCFQRRGLQASRIKVSSDSFGNVGLHHLVSQRWNEICLRISSLTKRFPNDSVLFLCPQSHRCCQCSSNTSMPRPTTRSQSPLLASPLDLLTLQSHGTGTFDFLNT